MGAFIKCEVCHKRKGYAHLGNLCAQCYIKRLDEVSK